jgi:hypothetical protein
MRLALTITRVDFGITEGVRDITRQQALVKSGNSWTLKSRHLPSTNGDGYSHAVDIAVFPEGRVDWQRDAFGPVLQAITTAAISLGVQINLGALWRNTVDCPHIELGGEYEAKNDT